MNVAIRTDASITIGTGHVMRCLVIADELARHGVTTVFLCRPLPGNLIDLLKQQGHHVLTVGAPDAEAFDWEEDAKQVGDVLNQAGGHWDWVLVDHYGIDFRWEQRVRSQRPETKIMVIDDLANRMHECELLLDQNYYTHAYERYDELVPDHCLKLLGPAYLLIRQEFRMWRGRTVPKDGSVNRLMVFFGGSDPTNETMKTLLALEQMDGAHPPTDIIVGLANPNRHEVERYCKKWSNVRFHCQTEEMAKLMSEADLSIGAGGVTMWERCYMGLPSLTIMVADNQIESTQDAAAYGAVRNLGWHDQVSAEDITHALTKAMGDPSSLREMRHKGQTLLGSNNQETHPVVKAIIGGEALR